MNRALLPVEHGADDSGTMVIDPTFRIVFSTNAYVGIHTHQMAGMEETLGPDMRYVMGTRRPLTVMRFWNDAVWENHITARDDYGIQIDFRCMFKVPRHMELKHFVESANRVSAALASGDESPTDRPVGDWQRSVLPAAAVVRLRVLPDCA